MPERQGDGSAARAQVQRGGRGKGAEGAQVRDPRFAQRFGFLPGDESARVGPDLQPVKALRAQQVLQRRAPGTRKQERRHALLLLGGQLGRAAHAHGQAVHAQHVGQQPLRVQPRIGHARPLQGTGGLQKGVTNVRHVTRLPRQAARLRARSAPRGIRQAGRRGQACPPPPRRAACRWDRPRGSPG